MSKPDLLKRIEGGILGCAIGDALSRQASSSSKKETTTHFSQIWITDLQHKNHYTGSTETVVKVAEVLSANTFSDESQILEFIALNLVVWLSDLRDTSIPSEATFEGLKQMLMGKTYFESWSEAAKDASAMVRSIPIGLTFSEKPEKLKSLAINQATITHKSPEAVVSSHIVGLFVSWAMMGITPTAYLENIFKYYDRLKLDWDEYLSHINNLRPERVKFDKLFFENGWSNVLRTLEKVTDSLEESPFEVQKKIGKGWLADEALANALYCVMKSPENLKEILLNSANLKSCKNYVSSVAGAIAGAYLMIDAIPEDWQKKIEYKGKLFDTAGLLYLGLIE